MKGSGFPVAGQFYGNKPSIRPLGWPAAMASSVALSQACGSTSFNFAVWMRDGGGAVVVTGEQGVFPCKDYGPQAVFDGIAIHFDAAVVEEDPEAVPVTGDIGELFAEPGLGRDAGVLLRQPFAGGLDQGRGARLSFGETQLRQAGRSGSGWTTSFGV